MANAEAGAIAVLAEKPSVARDIARVLGAGQKGNGYLHGNGYVVVWAIGHLAALAQPHEIRPEWRRWSRDLLPMLPREWPLVVYPNTRDQFETVRKILNSPRVSRIVCATDAGREGELIFRYIYEAAHCSKPFSRLWISSLTPEAIRKGFDALRPGSDYDPLADAARGRSRADWLVGMNLSRAYTLGYQEELSVGRVQTPTLAMVVERELAIRAFVPEDYLEVVATFHPKGAPDAHRYRGTWFRPRPEGAQEKESLQQSMRLPPDGEEAGRIVDRARTGAASIESISAETQRMPPPPFYDLTELQRHANRLYGFSAQKTLDVAQALYERHKLISYPRTDSRHLSKDVASTLPRIVQVIQAPYREMLAPGTGERPLGRRFVDDARVTDHHAIIPTPTSPGSAHLSEDERRIYDLVCRRLLSAWHADHVWSVTTVITRIVNGEITDRYHSSGSAVEQQGWKVLDIVVERKRRGGAGEAGDDQQQQLPPGLAEGQPQDVLDVEAQRKRTRPPKRFTEATLLTAMETAGKLVDEKELSDAMKETGLGTPATRAAIIEVLLKRGYIVRSGKSLEATDKGIRLIEVVHPEVKSPAMTGQWEAYLKRIERGAAELEPFLRGIEAYVREVVGKVGGAPSGESRAGVPRPRGSGGAGSGPAAQGPSDVARSPAPAGASSRDAAPTSSAPTPAPPPNFVRRQQSPSEAVKNGPPSSGEAGPNNGRLWADEASLDSDRGPRSREEVSGKGAGPAAPVVAGGPPSRGPAAAAPTPGQPRLDFARPPSPAHAASKPGDATPVRDQTPPGETGIPAATLYPPAEPDQAVQLLHEVFGFPSFRPNQEAVCRAAIAGRDVLLVMPTGSGKSLCYQLPGLARGGTTLVISPLIALMEDQVARLQSLGIAVERIHSGRDRAASRQACIDYLNGHLRFLFIAPERLRVAGFPEMLAKRRPSLIAIDEAHCISQWGHDFRPDYRKIGEHLPNLRPAPVMALTATATPIVQDDIARQLGLDQPERFIHGFRRDNIAIEVVEAAPSARCGMTHQLLLDPARRPAIVYAPTRKQTDALAAELRDSFPVAPYHAGLDAHHRKRVQLEFLEGRVEVMVATIAFGMGIDKPDVRTVVHTALPASVEAYYQEIGRAGRDGKPSRAILMQSYADRRTHDFFFERDYPAPEVLDSIYTRLGPEPEPQDVVRRKARLDEDTFDKALEKLWIHGGAVVDYAENVSRGLASWRESYVAQAEHKQAQIELMIRYAEGSQCRMCALVRHFGDYGDANRKCGICDFCAPGESAAQQYRDPDASERSAAVRVIDALLSGESRPTGRLHMELFPNASISRDRFEEVLGGLARAGLVRLADAAFEKDGRSIQYRKVALTQAGAGFAGIEEIPFTIREDVAAPGRKRRKRKPTAASRKSKQGRKKAAAPPPPQQAATSRRQEPPSGPDAALVEERLRVWRREEAKRRGVPAFRILTDQTLRAIVSRRPASANELLAIPGIGLRAVELYGGPIFHILHEKG